MGLQFVLGRANTDKRKAMVEEMAATLRSNKDAQIFYLVPEHVKFQAEMTVLEKLGNHLPFKNQKLMGMMRLQVFGFSRLAWYFLQNSDTFLKTQLTETGLSMLIRKLLIQHEEKLTIYRGEVYRHGFVQKMTDLFLEMRSGRIEEQDLYQMIQELGNSPREADFKLKLQDISFLFEAFQEALVGKYIEQEDILNALIRKLEELDLSQTTIYVESFLSFTAKEQELLLALMQKVQKLTIVLTLDKGYPTEKPATYELFYQTGETYYRMYQVARQNGVQVHPDILIQEKDKAYCPELNLLEEIWVETSKLSPDVTFNQIPTMHECIEVWAAEDKQAEVEHTAKEIRRLVSSGKYRYKDILVLTRNMEDYLTILEPIFNQNGVDVFIDREDVMVNHPLVEFLDSLFMIKRRNWRYQDVMRLLRTELLLEPQEEKVPQEREERVQFYQKAVSNFRDKVDLTDNVMLAYRYEGNYWTQAKPWNYTRFQYDDALEAQTDADLRVQQTANQVKDFLSGALVPLFRRLDRAKTGAEAATVLYRFLERFGIHSQLAFWRDEAIEEGDLETARRHEQTWSAFLTLLDEYVEVLGDQEFQLESFQAILNAGFENTTYSIIPPTIDQVVFSDLDFTRFGASKVTFLLGMTDTRLPANAENNSILTEEDRQVVSGFLGEDKYLKPNIEAKMASEPFTAYQAFLDSSDKLYFTYPSSDDSKEGPKISPYVERVRSILDIPIQPKVRELISLQNLTKETVFDFVGTQQSTLSQLLTILRQRQDQQSEIQPSFWTGLYRYFIDHAEDRNRVELLRSSLTYKNKPVQLKPELAEALYGKDLHLSISQLEAFYADPYSHFLLYGLRLQERPVFELSPAGTGTFFHEALDSLFKTLVQRDLSVSNLNQTTLQSVADEVLESLYGKERYSILSVSNRMRYIRSQLGETIKRVVWALGMQSRRSNMKNVKTEVLFGKIAGRTGVEGLSFSLKNGGQIHVRGKIDRIDDMQIGDDHYLSVVDYKSSRKKFQFLDAYYGLAMQMITYLDTAITYAPQLIGTEAKPAGALFFSILNPFLKAEKLNGEEDYIASLLKEFKYDGLLLKEDTVLRNLDPTLQPSSNSLIYPIKENKNETFQKSDKFVTLEEMNILRQHNQKLIVDAGNQIISGVNELKPIEDDYRHIPSVNGPWRAVSQFDAMLPENNYQPKRMMDRDEIIEQMKRLGGKEL